MVTPRTSSTARTSTGPTHPTTTSDAAAERRPVAGRSTTVSSTPPTRPARRRLAGERARSRPTQPAPVGPDAPAAEATTAADATTAVGATTAADATTAPEVEGTPRGGDEQTRGLGSTPGDVDGEQPPAGPRRRRSALVVVLAAVLAVALAVSGVLFVLGQRAEGQARDRDAALGAARVAAARVLSYDYRRLDADFAAATRLTTGRFRTEYEQTTKDAVRQVAGETKAVVTAEVASAGVVRTDGDDVVVLAFVNQTTTSSRLQRPQVDLNRVEMTMTKVGERWLVSRVTAH